MPETKPFAGHLGIEERELGGLIRPIEEDEFASNNIWGRYCFLSATQKHWPELWYGLKTEVFDRCQPPSGDRAENAARMAHAIEGYLPKMEVFDPWLVDTCVQTVICWRREPLESLIEKGLDWFTYIPNEPVLPLFEVHVTDRQRYTHEVPESAVARRRLDVSGIGMETPAEFKTRVSGEFAARLDKYVKFCEARVSKEDSTTDHAGWTALAFSGKTNKEIADNWPGMNAKLKVPKKITTKNKITGKSETSYIYDKYTAPEEAVRVGVWRFAKEIGLQRPRPRNNSKTA